MTYSKRELKEELLRRRCISSFEVFVKTFWSVLNPGVKFEFGRIQKTFCNHLQAVAERRGIKKIGFAVPPGSSKTTIISLMYPVWCWLRWPERRYISCTQALPNSYKMNTKRRTLITSELYQNLFKPVWSIGVETTSTKGLIQNSSMGEIMAFAVGARGTTSNHADEIICDDMLDASTAYSPSRVDHIIYWDEVLSSRYRDKNEAILILVQQRLHPEDLFGVLRERNYFDTIIILPAKYSKVLDPGPSPIGWYDWRTEEGELLDPIRLTEEYCQEQMKKPRVWLTQYQQSPTGEFGNLIDQRWWRRYLTLPSDGYYVGAWDLIFGDGAKSDYAVGQVWKICGADCYLVDQRRGQWNFSEQIKMMKELSELYPMVGKWYVENKANGAAAIDTMKKSIRGLIPWSSSTKKEIRISTVAGWIESGNIYVPYSHRDRPWIEEFLKEGFEYPSTSFDDQLDCMSIAILATTKNSHNIQQTIGFAIPKGSSFKSLSY